MQWAREHMESLRVWAWAVLLTPGWAWVTEHWAGFWWSSPVVWICIFWGLDWCLGSGRALWDGYTHPADPTRGFRARRAAASVGKLLVWLLVLMVAWGMRDSHMLGGNLASACLEAGVLLTEASSVLYHLGELTGAPFLRFYAAKFRRQAGGTEPSAGK